MAQVDGQVVALLVQNLERLDESVKEEADGVHNTLGKEVPPNPTHPGPRGQGEGRGGCFLLFTEGSQLVLDLWLLCAKKKHLSEL